MDFVNDEMKIAMHCDFDFVDDEILFPIDPVSELAYGDLLVRSAFCSSEALATTCCCGARARRLATVPYADRRHRPLPLRARRRGSFLLFKCWGCFRYLSIKHHLKISCGISLPRSEIERRKAGALAPVRFCLAKFVICPTN